MSPSLLVEETQELLRREFDGDDKGDEIGDKGRRECGEYGAMCAEDDDEDECVERFEQLELLLR